ncbi:MAG: penicillin-binding protein 1C [Alphaproteobacteria bacterium]|nr:penicillin-binding protein 1C [Alphaproteobacteria bacterium]
MRSRRLLRRAALAAAGLALAGAGGFLLLDRALPPDLSRLGDISTEVLDRDGRSVSVLPTRAGVWRLGTAEADVPPLYLRLLMAYEDQRFAGHYGVDPLAIGRAAGQWLRHGRIVSGGSTITMQVARLLEPRPRTILAKAIEAFRAVQLERRFSKREILGMYLTLAPFGGNVEGVRGAAMMYFGRPPHALDIADLALLVALPQRPSAQRPDRYPSAAAAGREKVLARALARGVLTEAEVARARAAPVPVARAPMPRLAPHLAWRLAREAPGARIPATLDRTIQAAAEEIAREAATALHPRASVAVLIAEARTRLVRAYVGGADAGDEARAGRIDLVGAVRSPGSALKPFIYAMGFDDRVIHPDTRLEDLPQRFGGYAPENFGRDFAGDISVREALQMSLNVPAVAILNEVGPLRFTTALKAAGVTLRLPRGAERPGLPIALGGVGLTLWDLAALYAAYGDEGRVAPLRLRSDDAEGRAVAIFSPAAAAATRDILAGTPAPPGHALPTLARRGRQIAYKTGTSYGFRDAWAAGIVDGHVIAVWVGRPDGTPLPGHTGRRTAAPILFRLADLLPETPTAVALATPRGTIELPRPAGLARMAAGGARRGQPDALRLLFPANGSVVQQRAGGQGLALRAEGGRRPFVWLVDGRPIESERHRRDASWTPEGPGFYRVTVIDATGAAAAAELRVR